MTETFACWWGLLLIQCFWYWNLRNLCVFYSLPSCKSWLSCWSVPTPLINITGKTSISDYQRMNPAWWLHWCLTLWQPTGHCTAQALRSMCYYALISNDRKPLHTSVWGYWHAVISVELLFLILPYWLPVIQCLFCVCFSHCTKCKKQIKIISVKSSGRVLIEPPIKIKWHYA